MTKAGLSGGAFEPGLVRLCQEKERSHLHGGRLCWQHVAYQCARCGKRVCATHTRLVENETICLSCAATPR